MVRYIGMDVHREFAQLAVVEDGQVRDQGRIGVTPEALRRQVTRRAHLVRQRTRIKNQVHAILARNLAPTPPVSDLFGIAGRHWLSTQPLPADERSSVQALLRQLDFHGAELRAVDKEL